VSDPFYAEIRIFGFNFAPVNWALCNGQLLNIRQNTALFTLLGTNYGGDGITTFGLPNLQGACTIGEGNGPGLTPRAVGEQSGSEAVTLVSSETPSHTHAIVANGFPGTTPNAIGSVLAQISSGGTKLATISGTAYSTHAPNVTMAPVGTTVSGGGTGHNNMAPYLVMNFCICILGIFPARQAIGQDKLGPGTARPPKSNKKVN
jgi:microcystin-dependent protein